MLIMDEPTAALSAVEVRRLFGVVEALRAEGAAVVFVSHRLEEVFEICQRVTVLRDGARMLNAPLQGMTTPNWSARWSGATCWSRRASQHVPGQAVLEVEHLTREGVFYDVSFEVCAGEVVASRGWSVPAAPRWPARSSASTAMTSAWSGWAAVS